MYLIDTGSCRRKPKFKTLTEANRVANNYDNKLVSEEKLK